MANGCAIIERFKGFVGPFNEMRNTDATLGLMKLEKHQVDRYYALAEHPPSSPTEAGPFNSFQKTEYGEELRLMSNNFFDNYYSKQKQMTNRNKMNEPNHVHKERLKKKAEIARENRARETEEKANLRRMKNALRAAFRRKNESPDERNERRQQNMIRARIRRQAESDDEKIIRRSDAAARASCSRSKETEEQANMRRMKNALRAAMRRQNESPEQREERLKKNKMRARIRRKSENKVETKVRRYNDAVRAASKRIDETEEERTTRRLRDTQRAADRRKEEMLDQRELRLDRDRVRKKRTLKKMFEQIHRLSDANELPVLTIPVKTELFEGESLTTSSLATLLGECGRSNMEMVQETMQKPKVMPMIRFPTEAVPEVSVKVECFGNHGENGVSGACDNYWDSSTLPYPHNNLITHSISGHDNGSFSRNLHSSNIAEEHSINNVPAMRNFLQL